MAKSMKKSAEIEALLRAIDLAVIVQADVPALARYDIRTFVRHAPCPKCGGHDRFNFRLGSDGIGRVYCTHCAPLGLDAIGYVMWRDGVDFKTAKSILSGVTIITPLPQPAKSAEVIEHSPSSTWQTKARAFVDGCAEYLWTPGGVAALDYLRQRCLTDETIRAWHIGYNPKRRQASGPAWGLAKSAVASAAIGITIPRFILGELWAVNVRRMNPDGTPYAGSDKYICVSGSRMGLLGADDLKTDGACFVFGGDFDAILARQHAPEQVACVTFGGEGRTVSQPWLNMLSHVESLYICLDNDNAGDQGAAKWVVLPEARRVRVPLPYKDLTEYAQAGGDVSRWITDQLSAEMAGTGLIITTDSE